MPVDLYAYGSLPFVGAELCEGLGGIANQPVGRYELGIYHVGPLRAAEQPEGNVSDVLHRGQQQRPPAQVEISDSHRLQKYKMKNLSLYRMENIYQERIERLRGLMRARNWDTVLVTGGDPHGSEYPAERWKQVQWLSGFTGEAGDIVVTLDHAGLWTDTRYFIQARRQLEGTGVELHKTRVPGQVLIPEWLEMQFGDEGIIALDGLCAGVDFARSLPGTVVSVPDMLSLLWQDRPEIPDTPVFTVQAGETRESKLAWLRDFIAGAGCDGMLLTALDEIAWLLNVRAADIEYNPLVISCLLVTDDSVEWFVTKDGEGDPQTSATMDILRSEGISVRPYLETEQALPEFRGRLFVDCSTLNWSLFDDMRVAGVDLYEGRSPVGFRKAVKNSFELDGMRSIHVRDGVAMERFLYWLEKSVQSGKEIYEIGIWEPETRKRFRDFSPAGLLQFSLKVLTIREKNTKISASRSLKLSVLLSLA